MVIHLKIMTAFVACSVFVGACIVQPLERCAERDPMPGETLQCPTPGWTDRAFTLHIPPSWDGRSPLPLIIAFHGGGSNRGGANNLTCPDGESSNPQCLHHMACQMGFALVLPDGTGSRPLRNIRTWNGGGGDGTYCASGAACNEGVDDMGYVEDLLEEIGATIPVDSDRIHATGFSNGAALTHRLACQRPGLVASIAAVGGANQWVKGGGVCAVQVPVLQIHGTEDPCWTYEPSDIGCLAGDNKGEKAGVEETMEGWRLRNGCRSPAGESTLPDNAPDDGTRAVLVQWPDCTAPTQSLRIEGGGHTWPGGYAYLSQAKIGRVCRDFSGNQAILEFFLANPKE